MRLSCFGLPSVISETSPQCANCADKRLCAAKGKQIISVFKGITLAHDLAKLDRCLGLPQKQTFQIDQNLPVRVQEKLRGMQTGSKTIDHALVVASEGGNPFDAKRDAYLNFAYGVIKNAPITRKGLRLFFMQVFNWTRDSAASKVSVAIGVMQALGLVRVQDDQIIMNEQNKGAHNVN